MPDPTLISVRCLVDVTVGGRRYFQGWTIERMPVAEALRLARLNIVGLIGGSETVPTPGDRYYR